MAAQPSIEIRGELLLVGMLLLGYAIGAWSGYQLARRIGERS